MKLILINRYFYPDESATSRMATSLARALKANGASVHVLASRNLHNDNAARLGEQEEVEGVVVHRVTTTTFGRDWLPGRAIDYATFHLATAWRLLGLVRRGDVCIVCTDPPLLSVTALLPILLRRGVLVNWLLDLFPEIAAELGIGRRYGPVMQAALWLRDLSLRLAHLNVAPIQRMAEHLEDRGIPPDRLLIINHWSDGAAVRPVPRDRNPLREEWGLGDRFIVGYSGNFGRAHEFDTFLAAAELLRDREEIAFVFVGGGHKRDAIAAAVAERGLRNVLLKPLQPRERLAEALSLADLHLISLLPPMEPFIVPSKLYGILAAGRPTAFVGDLSGEIATVLRAGDCGRSVEPGDGKGLAGIILELARIPELRDRLGYNARRLFESRFAEGVGTAAWQLALSQALQPDAAALPAIRPHDLSPL